MNKLRTIYTIIAKDDKGNTNYIKFKGNQLFLTEDFQFMTIFNTKEDASDCLSIIINTAKEELSKLIDITTLTVKSVTIGV